MLPLLLLSLLLARSVVAAPAPQDSPAKRQLTQTMLVTVTQTSTATRTETLTSETTASTPVQQFAPLSDNPKIPHHIADNVPRPANAESIFFLPPAPTALPAGDDGDEPDSDPDQVYSGNSSTTWASRPSPLKGPLVAAYYPDWATGVLSPEDINFGLLNWIDFAFAVPDARNGLTWDDPSSSPSILKRLVAAAHSKKSKVKLSIGGWTGSK